MESRVVLEFDAKIYSEQAIKRAIYDLDIAAHISKSENNEVWLLQVLSTSNDNKSLTYEAIFKAILDQQIRIDTEKEFGGVRNLILAQAFFPCENLEQLLDENVL